MTKARRSLLITLALALLAGAGGALIGVQWTLGRERADDALHALLHDDLDLSAAQERQIASEEERFGALKTAFENRIRAANAELAVAMRATRRDGPEVQEAVDHVHAALGDYQKETVSHIFRMRSALTPGQAEKFDRTVADALTNDPR